MIAGPHGGAAPPPAASTATLGIFRAEDYGAHSLQAGGVDASGGISMAAAIAAAQGGGVVMLDSGLTYAVRRTIALPANVELMIPTGTVLQAAAGLVGDVVTAANAAGVRISGGGTIDANRAAGTTGNAVTLTNCLEAQLEEITLTNAWQDGVALVNCTRAVLDVLVGACGRHGVYHSGSMFCRGQISARDNGQRVAGHGVVFDAASTDNGYGPIVATDTRAGGAKTQQYGVFEVPASGCDRNVFAPSSLTGNAAGTVSLVGANSGTPLAPGTVTNATLANGAVSDVKLASDVGRLNLLVNPGLENWQFANGPFTGSGQTCADRWFIGLAGTDTISVVKTNAVVDAGSASAASVVFTLGTGAGASGLNNGGLKTSDGYRLAGRTVSASLRVNTAQANGCRIAITTDGTGGGQTLSPFVAAGGWNTVQLNGVVVPADATLVLYSVLFAASGTYYVDNAVLNIGPVAADYSPLTPADDLARSERYREIHGGTLSAPPSMMGYQAAGNAGGYGVHFHVRKSITPTVTKNGTWAVGNCAQPAIRAASPDGYELDAVVVALGAYSFWPADATCTVTIEANP